MARYDFWTHGVNTFIEFPDRPMHVIYAGWGTKVHQVYKPHWNLNNWFQNRRFWPEQAFDRLLYACIYRDPTTLDELTY